MRSLFDLVSHSQMVITFQPAKRRSSSTFLSRSTFLTNFSSQNATFDFGVLARRHPGCLCQKQP